MNPELVMDPSQQEFIPAFVPTPETADLAEQFRGTPTEVPPIEIVMPPDPTVPDRTISTAGGFIAAYDKGGVHVALQQDSDRFVGYTPDSSKNVPLVGADRRGWRGGEYSYKLMELSLNAVARERGIMGRSVPAANGEGEVFDPNPFDAGEFIDMAGTTLVDASGAEAPVYSRALTEASKGAGEEGSTVDLVGVFGAKDGMVSWVTPEGKVQLAVQTEAITKRLQQLGYKQGDLPVPTTDGQQFKPGTKEAQALTELHLAKLAAEGGTITLDQRNTDPRFKGSTIPVKYLALLK